MANDESEPTFAPHGFPFGKLVLGALAGFALTLAFGVGAILAYQGQYADRIYPGVSVAGVSVAGLTREAARARLETALAGYGKGAVILGVEGQTVRIPYAVMGRRADLDTLVALAWSVGRGATDPLDQAAQGVRTLLDGTGIEPRLVVDAEAVAREVARAGAVIDRDPTSATVAVAGTGFSSTAGAYGRGLPRDEAERALLERLPDPGAPETLELVFEPVPIEPDVTDAEAASAALAATRMVRDVVLVHGEESWKIPAATVRSWITFTAAATGEYRPAVAPDAPTEALTALAKEIDQAPKDATFLVGKGSAPVGVKAGKNGRTVDVAATAPLVAQAVMARADGTAPIPPPSVEITVTTVEPELTTEEAQKAAPLMRRLSAWTTNYEVSERNGFAANITIPTRTINGTVVAPGAVFDFWAAIEPVTYARGYRDGGVIVNGHSEPTGALAGGICSCSTTLFNAAARAGLEIVERHNHYYYISRYPTGLDATVVKSGSSVRNMRFRNDTQFPLLIRGYASPGVVRFEIWGPPTGRTVTFSAPTISNVVRATDSVQATTTIPAGTRKRVEYPVNGMQVWVTRTVRDDQGAVIHQETWYSNYTRVNGLLLVGKKAEPTPSATPPAVPSPTPPAVPSATPSAAP